jgi:hypothetical protein
MRSILERHTIRLVFQLAQQRGDSLGRTTGMREFSPAIAIEWKHMAFLFTTIRCCRMRM